jgi:hypothetical protein
MRRSAFVLVAAAIAAALLVVPAAAITTTRHDPDDFEVAPDVHTTAKRRFETRDGAWRLRISVAGELGPDYRLTVHLDTREGPEAEFVARVTVSDLSLVSCGVRRVGGASIESNCDADPFRAWWGVARGDLRHDKVIRWRIVAREAPASGGSVTDLAPDTGWYP